MSDYTHINLKEDVDDQAPGFGLSPNIEARMARVPLGMENAGVSYLRLAPGFRIPFAHKHKNQEEVYVLVSGSARIKLEDEVRELKQWDAVRVHRDTVRGFEGGDVESPAFRELVASELLVGDALRPDAVAGAVGRLAAQGREELGSDDAAVRVRYDLRYAGQAFEITVPGEPEPDVEELRRAFDEAHERRYGYADPDATLELVTVRVAVALPGGDLASAATAPEESSAEREMTFDGERIQAAVLRGRLREVRGPAVCELPEATLVVPPGWSGTTDDDGTIVLERD